MAEAGIRDTRWFVPTMDVDHEDAEDDYHDHDCADVQHPADRERKDGSLTRSRSRSFIARRTLLSDWPDGQATAVGWPVGVSATPLS
jgi:hypothetical protein